MESKVTLTGDSFRTLSLCMFSLCMFGDFIAFLKVSGSLVRRRTKSRLLTSQKTDAYHRSLEIVVLLRVLSVVSTKGYFMKIEGLLILNKN